MYRVAPAIVILAFFLDGTTGATAAERPSGVAELVDSVRAGIVTLEVDRKKDLPKVRIGQLASKEARAYFERPGGHATGLLIDNEGHILTTAYNIGGELKSIRATLETGRTYNARVVAKSPGDDLALLRIDARPLPDPRVNWAGSRLEPGQIVFALGRAPNSKRINVTRGIVSAPARNGGRAFQTDAELNYGNVGGPLLNLDGEIVGIACFVGHRYPQWGVNSGVGFATYAKRIREILPELKKGKNVDTKIAFLGVGPDFEGDGGAKIGHVMPGSAADKAGLKTGDVIIEFAGQNIEHFNQLRRLIFLNKPGDNVKIKVKRKDEAVELTAVLGVKE